MSWKTFIQQILKIIKSHSKLFISDLFIVLKNTKFHENFVNWNSVSLFYESKDLKMDSKEKKPSVTL